MSRFIQRLSVMFVLLLPIFTSAQEWLARYNGPGDSSDVAYALALDSVGNVYITGWSCGSGTNYDYATVKYNSFGVEQWVARYDGTSSGQDEAVAIAVDYSGNVYVTGRSWGLGTGFDYATIKYDSSGVEQWVIRYDGLGSDYDGASSIAIDNSGNILVTGSSDGVGTDRDYATIKYDTSGIEQWVVRYNGVGNGYDDGSRIIIDNSDNIYVTGSSDGSGTNFDYATVKYNSNGVEQWVSRYGMGNHDNAMAIALDSMKNVYVTGRSMSYTTYFDYATIKYDTAGNEQWVSRYDGPGHEYDIAVSVVVDDLGNVYVTGGSYSSSTDHDYATIKYDTSGIEQWVIRYDGTGGSDGAFALALDDDNNVFVTGGSYGSGTAFDYATVKYNSSGGEEWIERYSGPGGFDDFAYAIACDNAGNIYITGQSWDSITCEDYATIKYSSTGVEENIRSDERRSYAAATIFHGPLQLPKGEKCKLFDITGRIVEPEKIQPGIYFIEIEGVVIQKVVKIR